jgi:hypothetical protein
MAQVFPGRFTAQIEGPFVVFLIGMQVNHIFAVHKWMPVAKAMPPMLTELSEYKESGFLGFELFLYWRGIATVQYWRSFEHLHAYAHARDQKHLPAWAAFNRAVGNNGSVGIWHETYEVATGKYESIFVNMPRFGLAKASEHAPVTNQSDSAKDRIQKTE